MAAGSRDADQRDAQPPVSGTVTRIDPTRTARLVAAERRIGHMTRLFDNLIVVASTTVKGQNITVQSKPATVEIQAVPTQ